MPGDGNFTLGCLLGQYGKIQSFDVDSLALSGTPHFGVGSWAKQDPTSLFLEPLVFANVHSSNQSIIMDVFSRGSGNNGVFYDHGEDNDAYGRWFPDITTHALQSECWARVSAAAYSGGVDFNLLGSAATANLIPFDTTLQNLRTIASVESESARPGVRFIRQSTVDSFRCIIDDVLTQIDNIIIHPEYSYREKARLNKSQKRSLGGELHTYTWAKHFAYNVPLEFLSDSHADLINWWWENQFNLAFTLDTSDTESTFITRIVNERQPIHTLHRAYNDTWKGVIQLESIDKGSLVF